MQILIELLVELFIFNPFKNVKKLMFFIFIILSATGVFFIYSKLTETTVSDLIEAKKQLKTIECKSTIFTYKMKPDEYKIIDGFVVFKTLTIKRELEPKQCRVVN